MSNLNGWNERAALTERYNIHKDFYQKNPQVVSFAGTMTLLTLMWYVLTALQIAYYLLLLDKLLHTEYHRVRGNDEKALKLTPEIESYVKSLNPNNFS